MGILDYLWASVGALGELYVTIRIPWDGSDGLLMKAWCRHKLKPQQHDFHHPEPCSGKCDSVEGV